MAHRGRVKVILTNCDLSQGVIPSFTRAKVTVTNFFKVMHKNSLFTVLRGGGPRLFAFCLIIMSRLFFHPKSPLAKILYTPIVGKHHGETF